MIEEKEILKRLSEGDKNVFEYIFKLYYEDISKYVFVRFIHDKEDTEDIVQNLFLKLWEKRDSLQNVNSIKSYLYKSAHNACINYFEHQAVKQKYKSDIEYRLKMMGFSDYESEDYDEKLSNVSKAIEELPEQTKKIFNLKYIEGLKYKEIAERLGISDKTVQTLIYRGLKHLRNKLIIILTFIILKISILCSLFIISK